MRWMWAACLVASGCVESSSVPCDDGRVCPDGRVCASVTNPVELLCVLPEQISDCEGKQAFDVCGMGGRCYDGVCLPAGCGNARTDPDEVCDDGNGNVGDGCTPDCMSDETCGNGYVDSVKSELCDEGDVVAHDGCTSTCTLEQLQWEQITVSGGTINRPRARWQSAMAYDVARGKVVLFGGLRGTSSANLGTEDDETWEWGGNGWVQRFPHTSPSARHGHAMAYDPLRKRVVMFGGEVATSLGPQINHADVWEWDGETWTAIPSQSATNPEARANAALAYDPIRKAVVLVGGENTVALGVPAPITDTWTWDGAGWTQLMTTSPPGTDPELGGFGSLVFDPTTGTLVYAGGGGALSTWRLTGTMWTQVAATGAFTKAGMAWDVLGQRILAFGGNDGAGTVQTSIRELTTSGWTTIGSMPAREMFGIATDLDRRAIVLHAGSDATQGTLNDTSEWRGNGVAAVAASASPAARARPALTWNSTRGSVILFGGQTTVALADTWELDRQGWHQLSPTGAPSVGRYYAALAHDAVRHQTVMFGGNTSSNVKLDETWVLDDVTGSWSQKAPAMSPSARWQHAMVYDASRGRVVLFGGSDASNQIVGDTWEWDGTTWAQVATSGPLGRVGHVMSYDYVRQRVLLTGGGNNGVLGDTWLWDGTTWANVTQNGAALPRKIFAGMAWDPARRVSVLFGGLPFDDVIWSWDGTRWQSSTAAGPTTRVAASLVTDPLGAGVILFGGDDGVGSQNDAWRLTLAGGQPYESCREPVDLDGDGKAGCEDIDCWATCTPQCPPLATCDAAAPRCGDGVCNSALETHRQCPADCTATAACGDFICEASEIAASCPGDCP